MSTRDDVTTRPATSPWWQGAAVVAVVSVLVATILLGPLPFKLLALLAVVGVAAVYLTFVHNVAVFALMAFVLGAAPSTQTPGISVSVLFLLCGAVWVGLLTSPRRWIAPTWADGLVLVLIVASAFSWIGHVPSGASTSDFVRWATVSSIIYPLRTLSRREIVTVGRWFVAGCSAAAVLGIGLLASGNSTVFSSLGALGYDPEGFNDRLVVGPDGSLTPRLIATYIDPNIAGLVLGVGAILALALLRGWRRVAASGLLLLATALTLSRSVLGSMVVAGLVLVVFGGLAGRVRLRLALVGVAGALAALSLGAVRSRLTNSFDPSDIGTNARRDALADWADTMRGSWILGKGFGSAEFTDATIASTTNYVANAPFVAMYRGGLVVGLVFVVLLLVGLRMAWRMVRSDSFETAVVGAGFIGLTLVALQLDFPVVTLLPAIAVFMLLLAFMSHPTALPRGRRDEDSP